MTDSDRKLLDRINKFAEKELKDIDPQSTPVSFQIEKLKPILSEISKELSISLEDMFIKYMDLASEAGAEANEKLKRDLDEVDIEIR